MAIKNLTARQGFALVIALTLIVSIVIVLDVPFLRQYLGALFYTLVPGWLILSALRLNKLGTIEKLVLSVGLSLAFLIFLSFTIDKAYFAIGYATPLSTISLISSFGVILLLIAIVGYKTNRDAFAFALPGLDTKEKLFLILPALLPLLSIYGMHLMNTTDDNTLLMVMLFLLLGYFVFLAIWNRRVPPGIYPATIFLMGLSLVLMLGLRSSYIIGFDANYEYYLFQVTADNLHWNVIIDRPLDACLSISLLPAVYHSLLGGSEQYLFKLLYPLAFSVCPLAVYIIAKKYFSTSHAFLASFFFISQITFLEAAYNNRTVAAILFFSLALMVLLSDRIEPAKKSGLFILLMAATIVSHYSTAFIFFIMILGTWLLARLLSRKYAFQRGITGIITVLFFVLIFLWFSQLTGFETGWTFIIGVNFIKQTFVNLSNFFVLELRGEQIQTVLRLAFWGKGVASVIHVAFTWITFALIGIGVVSMLRRYKQFEREYLALVLLCSTVMTAMVVIPYVSVFYGALRTSSQVLVILAPVFVLGGIWLANRLRTSPSLVICLIMIPYFLSVTGVTYQIADSPYKNVTLNSDGNEYHALYIHDEEVYAAHWLEDHRVKVEREEIRKKGMRLFGDVGGVSRLASHGKILKWWFHGTHLLYLKEEGVPLNRGAGYIYLSYDNVVNNRMFFANRYYELAEFDLVFKEMRRIYNNGGSEIYG